MTRLGWGVGDSDLVIVYDDVKGLAAARAWWLLRQGGVEVRVLDGGLRAWTDAAAPLETGDVTPEPGTVTLEEIGADAISIDEAAALPASGILLDVRAPERYRGSGITAAHTALALAEAGIPAKVFPGSWSQWSNTPARPVATGALPG